MKLATNTRAAEEEEEEEEEGGGGGGGRAQLIVFCLVLIWKRELILLNK